jgi:hypothetical protein
MRTWGRNENQDRDTVDSLILSLHTKQRVVVRKENWVYDEDVVKEEDDV